MWRTQPVWPASAAQLADWPRPTEAPGSLRHDLAPREASGEPAGRGLSRLVFHTGAGRRRALARRHAVPGAGGLGRHAAAARQVAEAHWQERRVLSHRVEPNGARRAAYARAGSNPGLADPRPQSVGAGSAPSASSPSASPGAAATHTCEPRLGQTSRTSRPTRGCRRTLT